MSAESVRGQRLFFREAISRAVAEVFDAEPGAILLGQDVGAFGGAYREFAGLLERFGPTRIRDTPVAEAAMVGLGVGAAAAGMRPLVSITYMDFVLLALDPLVNYAAKARFKTGGQLRVPLVVKLTAGAKGQGVVHSQSFESWLMSVPGLRVVAPSNASDAYWLMRHALQSQGPVVYVDHKRLFPTSGVLDLSNDADSAFSASVARAGRHITIVTHSYMVSVALAAARTLAAEGVECEVIDLRSLAPLDLPTICKSVAKTGALLTLEEGQVVCGVGAEIACRVQATLGPVDVLRLGAVAAPLSSNPVLEAASLPDATRVADGVRRLLHRSSIESPSLGA